MLGLVIEYKNGKLVITRDATLNKSNAIFSLPQKTDNGEQNLLPQETSGEEFNLLHFGTGDKELDKAIEIAGYSYDPIQDIFYSNMDSWQKDVGYCSLYDQAAAPLGMIIDCEPIHFEYDNKRWLVELCKGQFDLVTGAEIGLYTEARELNIPDIFSGTFYNSASDTEMLKMAYSLKKNGHTLFAREDKHWWLAGFKLGEFSNPCDLIMDISITLNNENMRNAFIKGLKDSGYSDEEFAINENTVNFIFDIPHTPQPLTRTAATDWVAQKKNQLLCKKYQEITEMYSNIAEKLNVVKERDPKMYNKILNLGKNKQLFQMYETIKKFL